MGKDPEYGQVHVYGQPTYHSEAYITGDRAGLEALRRAVDAALRDNISSATVSTNDGEGYSLVVVKLETEQMDVAELPYTDNGWMILAQHRNHPTQLPVVREHLRKSR